MSHPKEITSDFYQSYCSNSNTNNCKLNHLFDDKEFQSILSLIKSIIIYNFSHKNSSTFHYGTSGFRKEWESLKPVFLILSIYCCILSRYILQYKTNAYLNWFFFNKFLPQDKKKKNSASDSIKSITNDKEIHINFMDQKVNFVYINHILDINLKNVSIGNMITASHNPACDNGIKIFFFDGAMLPESFEENLTKFMNYFFLNSGDAYNGDLNQSHEFSLRIIKFIEDHILNGDLYRYTSKDNINSLGIINLIDYDKNNEFFHIYGTNSEKHDDYISIQLEKPSDCTFPINYADNNIHDDFHNQEYSAIFKSLKYSVYKYYKERCTNIIIGNDTRYSAESLKSILTNSIEHCGCKFFDFGLCTTPQLHFLTSVTNHFHLYGMDSVNDLKIFYSQYLINKYKDLFTYTDYFHQLWKNLSEKFCKDTVNHKLTNGVLLSYLKKSNRKSYYNINYDPSILFVDCAYGVGYYEVLNFVDAFRDCNNVNLTCFNYTTSDLDPGEINYLCGSDFVQKNSCLPRTSVQLQPFSRLVSFDGDADRLIYYYFTFHNKEKTRKFVDTIDGSKILSLYLIFISILLIGVFHEAQSSENSNSKSHQEQVDGDRNESFDNSDKVELIIGIILTAYTNKGCSDFLENFIQEFTEIMNIMNIKESSVKIMIQTTKTGIKYLHSSAEKFHIGMYFESNGHGSIITNFSHLERWARNSKPGYQNLKSFQLLKKFLDFFNQSVGDAILNLMGCEFLLKLFDMSVMDFALLYNNQPHIYENIKVKREFLVSIKPNDVDESYLIEPQELQERINFELMRRNYRAFIRPSGTEDYLRIYIECPTFEECRSLLKRIISAIQSYFLDGPGRI